MTKQSIHTNKNLSNAPSIGRLFSYECKIGYGAKYADFVNYLL